MTLKNNLYNIFGGAGRALLFLITIPLMVKYMGVAKFGVWALITSVGNIAMLLDVGIASTTMHFVSEINALAKDKREERQSQVIPVLIVINVCFSLLIAIVFLLFTQELAALFLNENIITDNIIIALKWIGMYASVMLIQHLFSGIIQAHNKFLLVNVIKFFNIFTINFGLLTLSIIDADFVVFTQFMFVISLATLLVYIFLASKHLNIFVVKPKFSYKTSRSIFNYSANTWGGYFGSVIFTQFDKIVIGKFVPPEILGIYAAIISITSYISSIATVGLQPIIPKLTELWTNVKNRREEFLDEYKHAIQFNTVLIFLASLAMMAVCRVLLTNIMDIDTAVYPQSILAFQLAIFIYALNALSIPGFYTLMAIKNTFQIGIWQILGAFLALSLIYTLGKSYGIYGIMIGNAGLILTLMFNVVASKKILNTSFGWIFYIVKPIFLFVISFALILIADNIYVEALIVLIALIILVNWYFKQNPASHNLLIKIIEKFKVWK